MNVVVRGFRNAFRNGIRTTSIIAILGVSIGLSLAMLVAKEAVTQKIASVKASVGNTITISPAGVRGFEGGGEALKGSDIKSIADLAHVTDVSQTLGDRLTSDNSSLTSAIDAGSLGQRNSQNSGMRFEMHTMGPDGVAKTSFTPPITLTGTTDSTNLSLQGGGTFTLTDGNVFADDSGENVAVVGKSLAEKNSLKVGSTFTAYGTEIKVVGIFDSGNTFSNNQVIMPIKTVQALSGQTDAITSVRVTTDSIDNIASVTKSIEGALGSKADVTNTLEEAEASVKPLESIKTIATYSLIGSVACGALIILLTMIMIVRERRREIGVLKAIGASNKSVVSQFMSEAVTLTLAGAIIGIAFGIIAASPITNMLVENSTDGSDTARTAQPANGPGLSIGGPRLRTVDPSTQGVQNAITNVTASVSVETVSYALVAAFLIALVGSAAAAYGIAKVRPAEVMRTE